jgi:hypothetical protein
MPSSVLHLCRVNGFKLNYVQADVATPQTHKYIYIVCHKSVRFYLVTPPHPNPSNLGLDQSKYWTYARLLIYLTALGCHPPSQCRHVCGRSVEWARIQGNASREEVKNRKLSEKLFLYEHKGVCVCVCVCLEFRNVIKRTNFN